MSVCSARPAAGVVRRRGRGPRHAADHAHQRGGGSGGGREGLPRPFGERARARRPRGGVRRHEDTEDFVEIVHDAVVAADTGDGGPVTYDGPAVDAALKQVGLNAPPAPIEIDQTTMDMPPPLTSGYIDDPINASNGNMIHREDDIDFPAIAAALNIARTWNSRWRRSIRGVRRRMDVGARHAPRRVGGRVVARLADGSTVAYEQDGDHWTAAGVPQLRLSPRHRRLGAADRRGARGSGSTPTVRSPAGASASPRSPPPATPPIASSPCTSGSPGDRSRSMWRGDGLVERLVSDDGPNRRVPARRRRGAPARRRRGRRGRVRLGRRPADLGGRRRRRCRLRQRVRRRRPQGGPPDQPVRAGVDLRVRGVGADGVLRRRRGGAGDASRPPRQPDGDLRRRRLGDAPRLRRRAAGGARAPSATGPPCATATTATTWSSAPILTGSRSAGAGTTATA